MPDLNAGDKNKSLRSVKMRRPVPCVFGGRYMDRTCDPCSVNAVLYR